MGETVIISKRELARLRAADEFLDRLHAAGVDNWEGYSEACGDDEEEEEEG